MQYSETQMYKEILEQPQVLKSMRQKMAPELKKIKEAFDKENLTAVLTAARGSSNNACTYFKYLCEIFVGVPCASAAPGVYTVYNGALKIRKNLVIGVSQSGKAADAIRVLEEAEKSGSVTVAITNDPESPMAKTARFHLFLGATKEESVAATKTFTAQMYALLLLAETLSGDKRLTQAAENVPDGVKAALAGIDPIVALAGSLKGMADSFMLGRGLNYAAALESGLKMQETTYVKSKAYAASDFHHGPFAMVDETATVFLLMPEGETYRDMAEMADKCEGAGAKTVLYTNGGRKGTLATLNIPAGSDIETPFYNVVVTQLLVNALSVAKGLTPDAPRGLNKITITK